MPATPAPASSAAPPARAPQGIQSVEVGHALLAVLADAPGALMLRDLAGTAGMSAAKAHRYLASFQRLGLVTQDPATSRYDLGPAALRLGLAALARLDAVKLARASAARLCAAIGHTTAVAVWGNAGPTIVHWEESRQPVVASLRLGDVMPLLRSATGRCFAAWLPRERTGALIERELAALPGRQRGALASAAGFAAWQQAVRARGAGVVEGDLLPGISALCHPVFDADGHLALGLVSLGPSAVFDVAAGSAIDRATGEAARALSRDLGAPSPARPRRSA